MARALIVSHDKTEQRALARMLEADRCECALAEDVPAARKMLADGTFDIVLAARNLHNGDACALLSFMRETDLATPVVLIAADATVEQAVDAMRCGAADVIGDLNDRERLLACIRRACDRRPPAGGDGRFRRDVRWTGVSHELVGDSPAMHAVREQIARVAPTDSTVLILGETGTGKELVAQAIHKSSRRAAEPFIAVNCAALSENLLESELFGHERGAFTGADRARQGLFEAAHHGTLFLDEAGEMPLSLQTKLLRVLMDGRVLRVGATTPRSVDVRIIAATHRDLQRRVAEGRFREDLFYRLAVFPLHIPPLRERREDLPALIEHCLKIVSVQMGVSPRDVNPLGREKLLRYHYPGNVRELRNIIERAYILARGAELTAADVIVPTCDAAVGACGGSPPCYSGAESWLDLFPQKGSLRDVLQYVEAALIRRAIRDAGGVQAEAARQLGLSRSNLTYKLKRMPEDA